MKSFEGYLKKKLGDSYVLLAGGGHKSVSDFATSTTRHIVVNGSNYDVHSPYTTNINLDNVYVNFTSTQTISGSKTFSGANGFTYSGIGSGTTDSYRPVWFSYNGVDGRPVIDTDFTYNPSTNILKVTKVDGLAKNLYEVISNTCLPTRLQATASDVNIDTVPENGFYYASTGTFPTGVTNGHFISTKSPSGYSFELLFKSAGTTSYNASDLYLREYHGTNKAWCDWVTILTSSNFSNFALPITGGTLTSTSGEVLNIVSTYASNYACITYQTNNSKKWTSGVRSADEYYFYSTTAGKVVAYITNSGNVHGKSFVKDNGTSSQFLKADGSVDSTSYATSDVNVTQTISTSGNTDFRPLLVSGVTNTSAVTPTFTTGTGTVISMARLYAKPSTGDLYLYNPDGGDSPFLYFQRGDFNTSGTFDWRMYVSGGNLYFQNDYDGWNTFLALNYTGDATINGNTILTTGNITSRNLNVNGTNYTVYSPYTSTVTIDTNNVTQTVTSSSNTDKRPILVGASSNSADQPSFSTTTSTVMAAHRLFMQPSTGNLYLYSPSGDSPSLYFQRGNFDYTYVDWRIYVSSGELLFNSTSGNSWATRVKFSEGGNVYAPNFYTTSDRSKKQNISSFSEHIRKFQLKDTEKWHYGVIAQEVPEMFRDGEEGNMTVNYNSILSYYVGCLENKVKELEEKVRQLENLNK